MILTRLLTTRSLLALIATAEAFEFVGPGTAVANRILEPEGLHLITAERAREDGTIRACTIAARVKDRDDLAVLYLEAHAEVLDCIATYEPSDGSLAQPASEQVLCGLGATGLARRPERVPPREAVPAADPEAPR